MRQQRHILFYMPDFYGHLVPLLLRDFMCKTDYIHYEKPLYYLPIFQFMYLLLSVTTVVKMKDQGKLQIFTHQFIWLLNFVHMTLVCFLKIYLWYQILNTFAITTGSKTKSKIFLFNKHFFKKIFILQFVYLQNVIL